MVLAACAGPGATSPDPAASPTALDGGLDGAASPSTPEIDGLEVGSVVPRGEVTAESATLVTPTAGGVVSVKMHDGTKATLKVPGAAVLEETIVTLRAFRAGSAVGVRMEPDGLWLQRPASLTMAKASGVFLRIGAQQDGDLYMTAGGASMVSVVRLRPAIEEDPSVLPTVLPDPGAGAVPPGESAEIPPVDPSDSAAAAAEAAAAEDEGRATDGEAAQVLAASWLPVLEPGCSDPADPAHARMAATRLTAGPQAPPTLPECMTRVLQVWANSDIDWHIDEKVFSDLSESIGGLGEISNATSELNIPLEGEVTGLDRATSWFLSAFVYALDQGAGGMFGADEPTGERCGTTPLQNGRMAASLKVEGETLRVTVDPVSGFYTTSCGGKPMDSDPVTWAVIRLLKGMGQSKPFEFVFPREGMSSNVFSQFNNKSKVEGKMNDKGEYVLETSEVTMSAGMVVNLFESMKDYEERSKASESASPSPSGQG